MNHVYISVYKHDFFMANVAPTNRKSKPVASYGKVLAQM